MRHREDEPNADDVFLWWYVNGLSLAIGGAAVVVTAFFAVVYFTI